MSTPIMFLGTISIIVYTLFLNTILYKKIRSVYEISQNTPKQRIIKTLLVLVTLILMIALSMTGALLILCYGSLAIISVYLIFKYRTYIHYRDSIISAVLSGIVLITTYVITPNLNSIAWLIINTVLTALAYLGGVAFIRFENLGHLCQFNKSSFGKFFLGMLLVTPPAILNAFATFNDTHITSWYHTLTAIKPAIFEELLFRFVLTTVLIFIGSHKEKNKNTYPVLFASFLSSIVFALLHGFNPVGNLIIVVLYALPLAFIYLLYGLEAAIGAHFITDFIRYVSVFIK